jgi:nucleoside-diphosphate-sugar epimerase
VSRVIVTGANGFIGSALFQYLVMKNFDVVGTVRKNSIQNNILEIGDINSETNWITALKGADIVIHTAARAHVMDDTATSPLDAYRKVNVQGTLNLARQAIKQNVKRFIFISSIKVNGEQTLPGTPFNEQSPADPEDAYGLSKYEAELGLFELSKKVDMEVVVIRPTLVYGAGVKGNFASMIRLLERGIPLPLGGINNKRSLIGLDNLVDLISTCISHPAAGNQVFLAADGEDLSTPELLKRTAMVLQLPCRLLPIPGKVLLYGATLIGRKSLASRLLSSLQVDNTKARDVLGWVPPKNFDEGLQAYLRVEN